MDFCSVRAIHQALQAGVVNGESVKVRRVDPISQSTTWHSISRARSDADGAWWVRVTDTDDWLMCLWSDVVRQPVTG